MEDLQRNLINPMIYLSTFEKRWLIYFSNDPAISIIKTLLSMLEAKDRYTARHSIRVMILSTQFSDFLGLDKKNILAVRHTAILHDIGKIGIDDSILKKEKPLTNDEFEEMKKHPIIGYNMVKNVVMLDDCVEGILYHHSRPDGYGYPERYDIKELSTVCKIVSICDSFDAMISTRSYRKNLCLEYAVAEIVRCRGVQFDEKLVNKFVKFLNYTLSSTEDKLQSNFL
jgi:HD-GYP domain-containing protein (c-di-GMP phosphodiesterase class II)